MINCTKCEGELNSYRDSENKPQHKCFRCGFDSRAKGSEEDE